jgi:Inner membrane protein YgaP-like, transmembrane domain
MKKNMGSTDRGIRIMLAIIMGGLYFTNTVTGAIGIVLLVLAVVFLLTSFVSFCPLYTFFGFNTNKTKQPKL